MTRTLVCLAALSSLWASTAVWAEDAAPAVATNLSLTTKYKYRGLDQSDPTHQVMPAIQGGFDYAMKNGFYVGNWNSSIGGPGTEVDLYGGYKGDIGGGLGYDVGVLQYIYAGAVNSNTTEAYGALSYNILTAKLSYVGSKTYFGAAEARGTLYLDLSANYEVVKPLTINAHVGTTRYPGAAKAASPLIANYYDYKLGVTYDLGSGFSAAGAVIGANKKDVYGDAAKGRFIATINKTL